MKLGEFIVQCSEQIRAGCSMLDSTPPLTIKFDLAMREDGEVAGFSDSGEKRRLVFEISPRYRTTSPREWWVSFCEHIPDIITPFNEEKPKIVGVNYEQVHVREVIE